MVDRQTNTTADGVAMTTTHDHANARTVVSVNIDDYAFHLHIHKTLHTMVLEKIAEAIAAEYVKAHLQDVLASIDPNAVANLAVADSAAAIRETVDAGVRQLHTDMQDVQRAVNREREVLTPGWFGVKRSVIR